MNIHSTTRKSFHFIYTLFEYRKCYFFFLFFDKRDPSIIITYSTVSVVIIEYVLQYFQSHQKWPVYAGVCLPKKTSKLWLCWHIIGVKWKYLVGHHQWHHWVVSLIILRSTVKVVGNIDIINLVLCLQRKKFLRNNLCNFSVELLAPVTESRLRIFSLHF